MKGTQMNEIYVSTDCETDGPIPGPYSMLSFASAAFLPDKTLLSTFSANLETLPEAAGHPDTLAWISSLMPRPCCTNRTKTAAKKTHARQLV